jgi:hypothetical protein
VKAEIPVSWFAGPLPISRRKPDATSWRSSNRAKSDKEAGVVFSKPVALVRNRPQPDSHRRPSRGFFQLDPTKLPVYVGTAGEGGGFSIYRLVKVIAPPDADPEKVAAARARIGEMQNRELFDAPSHAEGQGQGRDQPGQPRERK